MASTLEYRASALYVNHCGTHASPRRGPTAPLHVVASSTRLPKLAHEKLSRSGLVQLRVSGATATSWMSIAQLKTHQPQEPGSNKDEKSWSLTECGLYLALR